jgi:hypothetical protein
MANLYEKLKAAGLVAGHHESDLYAVDSPAARAIIEQHKAESDYPLSVRPFRADDDGAALIEIAFEYAPFWRGKGAAIDPA